MSTEDYNLSDVSKYVCLHVVQKIDIYYRPWTVKISSWNINGLKAWLQVRNNTAACCTCQVAAAYFKKFEVDCLHFCI